jgi:hypothetical protein
VRIYVTDGVKGNAMAVGWNFNLGGGWTGGESIMVSFVDGANNGYISITGYDYTTTDCSTSCDVTFSLKSNNGANTQVSTEIYADSSPTSNAKFAVEATPPTDILNTTLAATATFDARVVLSD